MLPLEVPAGVELGHQQLVRRIARDRMVELPGGHVTAVGGGGDRVEQRLGRVRLPQHPLPLLVPLAVQLEDERPVVGVRADGGADGDVPPVGVCLIW